MAEHTCLDCPKAATDACVECKRFFCPKHITDGQCHRCRWLHLKKKLDLK